jgi:hypothetical protein
MTKAEYIDKIALDFGNFTMAKNMMKFLKGQGVAVARTTEEGLPLAGSFWDKGSKTLRVVKKNIFDPKTKTVIPNPLRPEGSSFGNPVATLFHEAGHGANTNFKNVSIRTTRPGYHASEPGARRVFDTIGEEFDANQKGKEFIRDMNMNRPGTNDIVSDFNQRANPGFLSHQRGAFARSSEPQTQGRFYPGDAANQQKLVGYYQNVSRPYSELANDPLTRHILRRRSFQV